MLPVEGNEKVSIKKARIIYILKKSTFKEQYNNTLVMIVVFMLWKICF